MALSPDQKPQSADLPENLTNTRNFSISTRLHKNSSDTIEAFSQPTANSPPLTQEHTLMCHPNCNSVMWNEETINTGNLGSSCSENE